MMKMRRPLGVVAILVIAFSAAPLTAQDRQVIDEQRRKAEELRNYIKADYTKSEFMPPMRDGVHLFVAVYAPKDSSKPYPIWMQRTPYTVAPYGIDNYRSSLGPSEFFAREGYIFAYCDVRGRGKSEGRFEHVRPYIPNKTAPNQFDEASYTSDTIDLLLGVDPVGNAHLDGVNGRSDYWRKPISHEAFSAFWKAAGPLPCFKNIKAAVRTEGAWFDAEDGYGPLHPYQTLAQQDPGL